MPFSCRSTSHRSIFGLMSHSRFVRRLSGQRINLLPPALRLTTQRKRRLVQLLHAFDVHDLGGGPRDVARNDPPLRTRPTSIGRVERFSRPAHGQPSHPRLDCARRTRLSQTSARRLISHTPIPQRTLPHHSFPPCPCTQLDNRLAHCRVTGGTHPPENLRPPPTPDLSATVTPTCRDLAAALRGKTEASHARQVRAARHPLRPNP